MLLDTHAWRWLVAGDQKRIGPRARRALERASQQGALTVSTASMFELAALSTAGRIQLFPSLESWIRQSLDTARIQVMDVTPAVAIEAGSIPSAAIPDPLDRMLVATARIHDIPLATRDAVILDYIASRRVGRAFDVSK